MTKTKTTTPKNGFSIVGLGAAACLACCAGPILAFLGGLSVAGLASTWLVGGGGLVIATAAGSGFLLVRHRRWQSTCAVAQDGPAPIELTGTHPRSETPRSSASPSRSDP